MALLDNCVAYWRLEEASGARADSVGANTLTDNNTVMQAAGKVGNAAQFTSANSEYLSIADNAAVSIGNADFTLTAWFYLDAIGSARAIAAKDLAADREYGLFVQGSNVLQWYVFTASGYQPLDSTFGALSASTWYLAVAWHDAATDTIKLQVNNGTVDSLPVNVGGVLDLAAPFTIGQSAGLNYHGGRIDEVGIWDRILTAPERTQLYNGGSGFNPLAGVTGVRSSLGTGI